MVASDEDEKGIVGIWQERMKEQVANYSQEGELSKYFEDQSLLHSVQLKSAFQYLGYLFTHLCKESPVLFVSFPPQENLQPVEGTTVCSYYNVSNNLSHRLSITLTITTNGPKE